MLYRQLGTGVEWLARIMAMIGGAALIALILMTCLSITGRALGSFGLRPIRGDFEWVEIGVGFAIFCFLPWAQLRGSHARVDLFANLYGERLNRLIDVIADILMCAAAAIIGWRLWLGMIDKRNFGETTFVLQMPVWYGYAAGLLGCAGFVIVAAFCIWRSWRRLTGRHVGIDDEQS